MTSLAKRIGSMDCRDSVLRVVLALTSACGPMAGNPPDGDASPDVVAEDRAAPDVAVDPDAAREDAGLPDAMRDDANAPDAAHDAGSAADVVTGAHYLVVPIDWAAFPPGVPTDADTQRLRSLLVNATHYAVTTWWRGGYARQASTGYLDLGGVSELNVRTPANEAYALAVALRTGAYDPAVTGVSAADALHIAVRLASSVAAHHITNDAHGWGDAWESALWASYAGMAGWLLWNDLPGIDQQNVRQMVEHEANRFVSYTVPYYRNAAGTIVSPGDTKAEENAWNASVLGLATAMMPNHDNWMRWRHKQVELQVSAFSRPSDLHNTTVVNGHAVDAWLHGSNADENGVVINHNRIHPDYMTTTCIHVATITFAAMARQPAPRSALFNLGHTYLALVDVNFPASAYDAPGGTIYRDGSGDVYYPQGNDWGTGRRIQFVIADVEASRLALDAGARHPASYWEALHANRALALQRRGTDGRMYEAPGEDVYGGREQWVAQQAAESLLVAWLAARHAWSFTDAAY